MCERAQEPTTLAEELWIVADFLEKIVSILRVWLLVRWLHSVRLTCIHECTGSTFGHNCVCAYMCIYTHLTYFNIHKPHIYHIHDKHITYMIHIRQLFCIYVTRVII